MAFLKSTDLVTFSFYHLEKETEKAVCVNIDVNTKWCDGNEIRWDRPIWFPKSQVTITGNKITLPRWLAEEKDLNRMLGMVQDEAAAKADAEKASKYESVISRAKAVGIKGIRSGMRYATILKKAEEQGIVFVLR